MYSQTLMDRYIGKPRPWWVTLGICAIILFLPVAPASLDGVVAPLLRNGIWRILLAPSAIIGYILVIAPILQRVGNGVLAALRPLAQVEDEEFTKQIDITNYIKPWQEILSIGVGAAFGLWLGTVGGFGAEQKWLAIYWTCISSLMWGLLTWVSFVALASTRQTVALHRLPLRIDIFDITPFESIGRQSLLMSLVFIGGISISLLFSFQLQNLRSPIFWGVYITLSAVSVLSFFLNMRPTHGVLATEKKRQLRIVAQHIQRLGSGLLHKLDKQSPAEALPAELSAMLAFELRLREARTWPYNTSMLRSLFFSVLIPLVTVLARLLIEFIY